ncbi:ras family domain-containing protein [Ditylenchus destructor]|uniref:Ras family domain-containing protein n=1 Tax=Ditylenchus destructor TaxID=166010 RepID=A0AAD4R5X7_9BILA|nr:ras family domain-containing protein [Ditylenchus destructor]
MKPKKGERRSSAFADVHFSFTVMLLGDSCTGKTCLLIRYKDGTFLNNNFISTVGIDYRSKLLDIDKYRVKLQIYDTAGQERFRSITSSYYRDADALLLVFDVTNRTSFENTRDWLAQVREYAKETVQITLVGNKIDLTTQRKVKTDEAKQLAQTYNISYIETSAKNGHNVQDAFSDLAKRLMISCQGVKDSERGVIDLAMSQQQTWNIENTICGMEQHAACSRQAIQIQMENETGKMILLGGQRNKRRPLRFSDFSSKPYYGLIAGSYLMLFASVVDSTELCYARNDAELPDKMQKFIKYEVNTITVKLLKNETSVIIPLLINEDAAANLSFNMSRKSYCKNNTWQQKYSSSKCSITWKWDEDTIDYIYGILNTSQNGSIDKVELYPREQMIILENITMPDVCQPILRPTLCGHRLMDITIKNIPSDCDIDISFDRKSYGLMRKPSLIPTTTVQPVTTTPESDSSSLPYILVGAGVSLLITIVLIVVILRMCKKRRRRPQDQNQIRVENPPINERMESSNQKLSEPEPVLYSFTTSQSFMKSKCNESSLTSSNKQDKSQAEMKTGHIKTVNKKSGADKADRKEDNTQKTKKTSAEIDRKGSVDNLNLKEDCTQVSNEKAASAMLAKSNMQQKNTKKKAEQRVYVKMSDVLSTNNSQESKKQEDSESGSKSA